MLLEGPYLNSKYTTLEIMDRAARLLRTARGHADYVEYLGSSRNFELKKSHMSLAASQVSYLANYIRDIADDIVKSNSKTGTLDEKNSSSAL